MMDRMLAIDGSRVLFVRDLGIVISIFFRGWASKWLPNDSFVARPNLLSFDLIESSFQPQVLDLDPMKLAWCFSFLWLRMNSMMRMDLNQDSKWRSVAKWMMNQCRFLPNQMEVVGWIFHPAHWQYTMSHLESAYQVWWFWESGAFQMQWMSTGWVQAFFSFQVP